MQYLALTSRDTLLKKQTIQRLKGVQLDAGHCAGGLRNAEFAFGLVCTLLIVYLFVCLSVRSCWTPDRIPSPATSSLTHLYTHDADVPQGGRLAQRPHP